jgi:thiamine biosynthesis lipoprotein
MLGKQTLLALLALASGVAACDRAASDVTPSPSRSVTAASEPRKQPAKIDFREKAMGTEVHIISYATPAADEAKVRAAIRSAYDEIVRIERVMTTWREDSELSEVNRRAGQQVKVGPDTLAVIEKSIWAAKVSDGAFDVTYASMGSLWRFGDAVDADPKPPSEASIRQGISRIDYRKIEIDRTEGLVRIGKQQKLDLGGIAKGYAVDRAAAVLKKAGLGAFIVQAGGDLYAAGRKPDGSTWVSGIRDPRGRPDRYFGSIELENAAFSTAGDYARAWLFRGKRYHHIIDPKTGYPASLSRSVTIWAPDALTADAVDDAVFILGPERGLELVESLEGVGAVIVDAKNQVLVSKRLKGKVRISAEPSDGI